MRNVRALRSHRLDGQAQTKTFPEEARAAREAQKLIGEKLKRGYKEVQGCVTFPGERRQTPSVVQALGLDTDVPLPCLTDKADRSACPKNLR